MASSTSPRGATQFHSSPSPGAPGLTGSYFGSANLSKAILRNAGLQRAVFVQTNLEKADLTGCSIYGLSAWDLNLKGVKQRDLKITPISRNGSLGPTINVDDIEVAQFIYLLLHNQKLRRVIDTITSKVVLILGRFSKDRKAVLDAMRKELRRSDFVPVLFDFDKPASKDVTGTVETLARMARFIIVDLTDPSSVPHELATIVPFLRTTPIVPLRLAGSSGYSMFEDFENAYPWVLKTHTYKDPRALITSCRPSLPRQTKWRTRCRVVAERNVDRRQPHRKKATHRKEMQ